MAKIPLKPSGKGSPPQSLHMVGNLDKPEPQESATLNFKVPEAFKVEFKTFAAQRNKTMNRVLYEAFASLKAQDPQ